MAWGPTCETEHAHLINASGCAHGDAAVTPADLRCSDAPLGVCREQGQTVARRPGRRAVALQSTHGPLSTCCATGTVLGAPATFSAAGELWGFGGCAEFLGLTVCCDVGLFMGEAHAGIPFFNRTICLWNSGVRRTCDPCVRERLERRAMMSTIVHSKSREAPVARNERR